MIKGKEGDETITEAGAQETRAVLVEVAAGLGRSFQRFCLNVELT